MHSLHNAGSGTPTAGHPVISLFITIVILLTGVCMNACTTHVSRQTPVVNVVKNKAATVVNIRTERVVDLKEHPEWGTYGEQLDRVLERYYGEDYAAGILKLKSLGSGVIVRDDGLIVTNAHVVQKATKIFIALKDGTISEAKVVAVEQDEDLALIKAELQQPAQAVTFADIADLMIAETVIAIGNPLGLEHSVTVGVISGANRSFSSPQCGYVCSDLLQTDASINPGNSGGALLNLDGELVGINLAVASGAQNIGFAVPVHKIIRLLGDYSG
jgi:serine protease Do